jgi:hypothetical protein
MKKTFKDQCDVCKKMDYCKGYKGLVLCNKCIKKEVSKAPKIIGDKNGQTRFNF